ncbi:MAG: ComF family protein [Candidatus Eiseniibacteriota bacterium]
MVGSVCGRGGATGRLTALGARCAAWAVDLVRAAFPLACGSCGGSLAEGEAGELSLCDACSAACADCGEAFCLPCASRGGEPRRCPGLVRPVPGHVTLRAGFVWNEPVRAQIHALKFGDAPELGTTLARAAWDTPAFIDSPGRRPRPDLVVPVPLHPVRRRERGYDQAALLARAFADRAGVPDAGVLIRTRATRQQASLGARERRANVAGAFEVARSGLVRARRIAVVDDVVTTGSTILAAVHALEEVGASRVEGWCVAYEPSEGGA